MVRSAEGLFSNLVTESKLCLGRNPNCSEVSKQERQPGWHRCQQTPATSKSLHGLEQGTTKVLTIDFSNEVGSKVIRPNERLVRITGNQIKTPPIDNISDDTGLGTLGIIELTRSVDGTETVYLLSTVVIDDKIAYTPAGVLLKNATLLDGDKVRIVLPQDIPIVKASLVMAQLKKAVK